MKILAAGLTPESIVDGRGIRYTIFTQGCPHKCKGCHNPESWSMTGGTEYEIEYIFNSFCENPMLKGMTFSGGEPFCQAEALTNLARMVHSVNKDVTVYTGYTLEELWQMNSKQVNDLLDEIDVLIDGKYVEDRRNLELLFRGSENQRLIDMKATKKAKKIVLCNE